MKQQNENGTTALAVTNNQVTVRSVLENFQVYEKIGECYAKSCMFGEITSTQGTVAALTMACENTSPVQFKARWHLGKNGMLLRVTNSVLGDFQVDGGTWEFHTTDREVCDITFSYKGIKFRSTVKMCDMLNTKHPYCKESAYKAPNGRFLKDNWAEHPDDMLFARCCGKGLRRVWPKGMGGIYLKDEIEEDEVFTKPTDVSDVKTRIEQLSKIVKEQGDNNSSNDCDTPTVVVEQGDASICPIPGKLFGKPWAELDADILQAALNQRSKYSELTDAHIAAIEDELIKKGAQ